MNLASRRGALSVGGSEGDQRATENQHATLRISSNVMTDLCYQLSMRLEAGIPLARVLLVLGQTEENKKLSDFLLRAHDSVSAGKKLVDALGEVPTPFAKTHLSMVDAGEVSSGLPDVFDRMAKMFESQQALARQIRSALTYPFMVFVIAIGLTLFVLVKVTPQFAQMFTESKAELPTITKVMLVCSNFLVGSPFLATGAGVLAIIAGVTLWKTLKAIPLVQDFFLWVPALGEFIRSTMRAQFFIVLGQLTSAGVPLAKALSICETLHPYATYRDSVQNFVRELNNGKALYSAMVEDPIFGPRSAQLVETGEKSGNLGKILTSTGNRLEIELSFKLKNLTLFLEPLIIVVLSALVGILVAGLFLPIFQAAQTVQ